MKDEALLKKVNKDSRTRKKKGKTWVSFLSIFWLFVSSGLFLFRTDETYFLFVWPASIYFCSGIGLSLFAKGRWILLLLWLLFAASFVDEAKSFPRMALHADRGRLRVVTLNCAGGTGAAAEEILPLKPDVVLLQESPSEAEVKAFAQRIFGDKGSAIVGADASIVVPGKLTVHGLPTGTSDFVCGEWESGFGKLEVVSLRLTPPVMRIDLFKSEARQEFSKNRRTRRDEVNELAAKLSKMGVQPDILGGDFNTPPDPNVQFAVVDGLMDSFAEAGRGYGATCVNPYPCVVRIDQIWHSSKLKCVNSWVVKTEHSDHRMLVADYGLNQAVR